MHPAPGSVLQLLSMVWVVTPSGPQKLFGHGVEMELVKSREAGDCDHEVREERHWRGQLLYWPATRARGAGRWLCLFAVCAAMAAACGARRRRRASAGHKSAAAGAAAAAEQAAGAPHSHPLSRFDAHHPPLDGCPLVQLGWSFTLPSPIHYPPEPCRLHSAHGGTAPQVFRVTYPHQESLSRWDDHAAALASAYSMPRDFFFEMFPFHLLLARDCTVMQVGGAETGPGHGPQPRPCSRVGVVRAARTHATRRACPKR